MTEHEGLFSVSTRILLTAEQRMKLEMLVRERETDLADFISEIVGAYLDAQEHDIVVTPPPDPGPELARRQAELARLRARRDMAGSAAPEWLRAYISALETETAGLEQYGKA